MTIIETEKKISIYNNYDVVVCGGGVAGVSAALSASRAGAKTLLIEREFALGGLATLGMIVIYLPLCDGKGRQVSYGIAEELLRLSIQYGYEGRYPDSWLGKNTEDKRKTQRFEVQYNGNIFAILLEKLLLNAGVEILYGTLACGVDKEDDRLNAVFIENKSGRQAVTAKSFVDATGDADIYKLLDAETVVNESGNPLAAWYFSTSEGEYNLHIYGASDLVRPGQSFDKISNRRYVGLNAKELSEMVIESHNKTLQHFLQTGLDSKNHALSTIAMIPMIRMTRRIKGFSEMREADGMQWIPDSVGIVANWRHRGPAYEVPFSALHEEKNKNVISAGRIISADDEMWDVMRVIPACAVTGEAAGLAAAMSSDFSEIDVSGLQAALKKNGVYIHIEDLP